MYVVDSCPNVNSDSACRGSNPCLPVIHARQPNSLEGITTIYNLGILCECPPATKVVYTDDQRLRQPGTYLLENQSGIGRARIDKLFVEGVLSFGLMLSWFRR